MIRIFISVGHLSRTKEKNCCIKCIKNRSPGSPSNVCTFCVIITGIEVAVRERKWIVKKLSGIAPAQIFEQRSHAIFLYVTYIERTFSLSPSLSFLNHDRIFFMTSKNIFINLHFNLSQLSIVKQLDLKCENHIGKQMTISTNK